VGLFLTAKYSKTTRVAAGIWTPEGHRSDFGHRVLLPMPNENFGPARISSVSNGQFALCGGGMPRAQQLFLAPRRGIGAPAALLQPQKGGKLVLAQNEGRGWRRGSLRERRRLACLS